MVQRSPRRQTTTRRAGSETEDGEADSDLDTYRTGSVDAGGSPQVADEPDPAVEDPDDILNTALRCMRKHLVAIESNSERGRLLMFDQPKDVAGFVRALGAVATNRKKRIDEELGAKSLPQLLEEAKKIPSLREALAAMERSE